MGKTRDLFKGIFHAKIGTIKDRNGMDLSEKEDITKRWQYKKSELYKKDLHDPDNQNDVIIHIQADILDCEVKWAFSSVQFSHSVVFDSLQPHETQHARPPCPSPIPGVHSDSLPSSQWCHPAISSSVIPFSSCP